MPRIIRDDDALKCIFIKWAGLLSKDEADSYVCDVTGLAGLDGTSSLFHDMRGFDLRTSGSVVRYASKLGAPPTDPEQPRKVAFLVTSDVAFGMIRMLATLREQPGLTLGVFRDFDEARAWLDLPPDIGNPFEDMGPV